MKISLSEFEIYSCYFSPNRKLKDFNTWSDAQCEKELATVAGDLNTKLHFGGSPFEAGRWRNGLLNCA